MLTSSQGATFATVSGNVGIGTTTPNAKLEVVDSSSASTTALFISNFGSATSSTYTRLGFRTQDALLTTGTTTGSIGSILQQNFGGGKGDLTFATLRSGLLTEAMRILDTGSVGIGTTTPGATFSVQGNGLFSGTLSISSLIATSSTITFSGLGTNMLTSIDNSGNLVATSTPTAARYLATSSVASIFPYASTTALTVSGTGGLYVGTLTGPLQSIAGAVTATSTIGPIFGGTGLSSYTTGDLIYASGTNLLSARAATTNGYTLALVNGIPTWVATTTLSTISGTLGIANGGTNATSLGSDMLLTFNGTSVV